MTQAKPTDPFAVTGRKTIAVSPLHAPVHRLILLAAAGSAAAWLVQTFFGTARLFPIAAAAAFLGIAWAAALRLLFLDLKGRGFWGVWVAASVVSVLATKAGGSLWVTGAVLSGVFLLARRFRPFSYLTHRSRARIFFVSLAAWSALTWGWFVGGRELFAASGPAAGYLVNLLRYAWISLQAFWTLTLLHLFFKARLHSLKIRPKLAISTLLIAVVPLVWLLVMGGVTMISIVGEMQAARAGLVLQDWAGLAFENPDLARTLSGASFVLGGPGGQGASGMPPAWWPAIESAAGKPKNAEAIGSAAKGPGFLLRVDREVWGISRGPAARWTGGFRIDERFLGRMARIIHADVELRPENPLREAALSEAKEGAPAPEDRIKPVSIGRLDPSRPANENWRIGTIHLDLLEYRDGKFAVSTALLTVRTSPGLVWDEVYSRSDLVSRIIVGALIILGATLLTLEAFVLAFGIRITAGITSAVRALHRGARRIAAGDLETPIEIPNEDELGDLAAAINEMAAGVKRGRAEAFQREALERELAVAREIQERLLPHVMPAVPGFEISGTSLPSQQVGGDYFDFLDLEDGRLGIAIADVSGKGIPAALLMANLQAILRGQADERGDVSAILARVNNYLVRSTDAHMFATFFYGVLDRAGGRFLSSNAGHNPPLLLRADGRLERLSAGGLVLGFLANQAYIQQTTNLEPGDVVVLFTDGITEASSPGSPDRPDRFFGEEQLIQAVRECAGRTAGEIQTAILNAVAGHTAGSPQGDDITLVVIKRRAGS
ncbi:MAG: PP2C family protein-serine/threonine phosphatase [Candidatus Aminicenantes bacterium]|nr:PP2C family protein-serine/threonine phosphatase [Candidatus Aminicenantes bacterium]